MIKQLFLISLFFLCSCQNQVHKDLDILRNVYTRVSTSTEKTIDSQSKKIISFSANQMPMKTFAIWFSDTYQISFIYQENLSSKLLNLEFKNASIQEVIDAVSRYLGVDVIRNQNSYFVGMQKPTDKGVLVKKVRGVSVEDLKSIMSGVVGGEGDQGASVTSDGVVFLIDKEQNLQPILRALEQLEQDYKTAWVVQLYLFDLDVEKVTNAGVDLSMSGNVAYKLLSTQLLSLPDFNYNAVLDGLIDVSHSHDSIKLVSQPLFIMRDGKSFNFTNKTSFPYVKKVTTETGFIEDSDVEFIDSGMDLKVSIREMLKGSLLTLKFDNSKVIGFSDSGLPVRNIVTVNSEVPLHSSGVYLLCQSDYSESNLNTSWTHKNKTVRKSQLQIYAKIFKLDRKFEGITDKKFLAE